MVGDPMRFLKDIIPDLGLAWRERFIEVNTEERALKLVSECVQYKVVGEATLWLQVWVLEPRCFPFTPGSQILGLSVEAPYLIPLCHCLLSCRRKGTSRN